MLLPFLLATLPGLQADAFPLDHLEADLRFLADDVLAGRDSRGFGGKAAALWIESRFASLGLEPWQGNTRAPLRAAPVFLDQALTSLTLGKHSFAAGNHFLPHPSAPPGEAQGPLVFVDHGLAWSDPDFQGLPEEPEVSVDGAVVLLLRFQAQSQDPDHPYFGNDLHPAARLQAKVQALQESGARAI
ncbi:MAG: protease-associated domain-containing protein, partial [Planctomycetota bacterium]